MLVLTWLAVIVTASQNCLRCKYIDSNSGFMYNFGYCPENDRCTQDPGAYIWYKSEICPGVSMSGVSLDILETCNGYET